MRGNINRDMGRLSDAERDYDRARRLTAALPPAGDTVADDVTADSANGSGDNTPPSADNVPEAITERRFKSLLTIDDNAFVTLLGPSGLRQDHCPADDCRFLESRRGGNLPGGGGHQRPHPQQAGHRHGLSELRPAAPLQRL